ncbi:YueI family protein [Ornithinibacillus sp. BX22]|uniref:YueI family protein n=1 Tax=Ornithinibacillus hominis TaxID=2763055 RepID=A0A923RHY3_9BACI|nr:YueI family protein [Ornithinibacillus hominis]MBC5636860.1 YueI family protein [Ornithinibacillus hominis]
MSKKNVEDYLTEGIYGTRLPKQEERDYFLGTLRERIVIALTIGQVMTDKGIQILEENMKHYPDAKLLFNGKIASRFLKAEKELANKYNISYTVINNEAVETDIGAVLTYDYAIDKEAIFMNENNEDTPSEEDTDHKEKTGFLSKLKRLF